MVQSDKGRITNRGEQRNKRVEDPEKTAIRHKQFSNNADF